jgi:hypothetical protein
LKANQATLDETVSQSELAANTKDLAAHTQNLTQELAKDSSNMKIIAILTALFLPGTFMAVSPPLSS